MFTLVFINLLSKPKTLHICFICIWIICSTLENLLFYVYSCLYQFIVKAKNPSHMFYMHMDNMFNFRKFAFLCLLLSLSIYCQSFINLLSKPKTLHICFICIWIICSTLENLLFYVYSCLYQFIVKAKNPSHMFYMHMDNMFNLRKFALLCLLLSISICCQSQKPFTYVLYAYG